MEQQKKPLTGKRLLVAEDQAIIAMDYVAMLSSAGAVVATAATSAQAIDLVRNDRVDAAVLDFVLADSNSSTLQEVLEERGIPFVVVSGYPSLLVRSTSNQRVLHKPVSADILCAAVVDACDRNTGP